MDIELDNTFINSKGKAELVIPYWGFALQKKSQRGHTQLWVSFESNVNKFDEVQVSDLGRFNVDHDWTLVRGDFQSSFYLEPLLFQKGWKDPASWSSSTLAHELSLHFRGQYTFNDKRLITHQELIVGGFFSVRGYPQSVAAGDSGFYTSAEYRFHFPRILKPYSKMIDLEDPTVLPEKFLDKYNIRPPRIYGKPD